MGNAFDIQRVLQSTEKVHGSNKMPSNPLQGLPEEPKNFRLAYDSLTETSATYMWEPGKYREFAQRFVRSYWLMNEEYGTIATEHFSDENTIFYTVGDLREASLYQVCPALLNDKTKGLPDVPRKLRRVDDRLIETTLTFIFTPEKYRRYSHIYVRLKDAEKHEVKETIDTFHSMEKGSLYEFFIFYIFCVRGIYLKKIASI